MTPSDRSQRITEICELAAQLRPEVRESFVEKECNGDPSLIHEVQACMAGTSLDSLAAFALTNGEGATPAPPPFQKIGRYEVTGIIGSGGSGHVYSAVDRAVGRVVAIKILHAPGDPDLVRRFHTEAKTAANLHHKNIITVHEYGEQDGTPYLVMEYLNGTTMQELIARQSLSLLEKLQIMTEVAEGLQYAHEHGITHRDVKPANIMRLTDGSVKIMDFGIARLGAPNSTRLTQSGLVVGSLMYMAPEQFNGTADAITDIFAYGVTFFELLTGTNPYASADPVVIIFRVSNTDLPPLRQVSSTYPESLERIVKTATARAREERYSSLSDLLPDIRGVTLDLGHAEAGASYKEAAELFAANQLDTAKLAVRKALSFDPMHAGARTLRSAIEDRLRRRDATVRGAALMNQADIAIGDRRFEDAGELLKSVRELGADDPHLHSRVERAEARILQAAETDRLVQEQLARVKDAIGRDQVDEALQILAELEKNHPDVNIADLRLRAESKKALTESQERLAQGVKRANDLLKGGLFELAIAKVDSLASEFPNDPQLHVVRATATQRLDSDRKRARIAEVKAETERLIAAADYPAAIALVQEAIAQYGDEWDLTRLHLQASVAMKVASEEQQVDEAAQEEAAADEWRERIAKLEAALGPAPMPQAASPPPAPVLSITSLAPIPSTPAISTAALSASSITPEALQVEPAPDPVADVRSEPTIELPPPVPAPVAVPVPPRRSSITTWVAAATIGIAILIMIFVMIRSSSRHGLTATTTGGEPSGPDLRIEDPVLYNGARGKDFAAELHVSGGTAPVVWKVSEGSLPNGVAFAEATGRFTGAPEATGTYIFAIQATDKLGHMAQRAVTIEVADPPVPPPTTVADAPPPGSPPVVATKSGKPPPVTPPKPADAPPPAPSPTAPMWAGDGGDARRSGYSAYRGPRKARIAWAAEAGNPDNNSPMVGPDGRIYVWNAHDRALKAVENGATAWSVPLPLSEQVAFGPDGLVQLTSMTGRTKTLNREGTPVRDDRTDMRMLGLFTWKGHAYSSAGSRPAGSDTTRWYFFRADDRRWQVEIDAQAGRPVVDENGVIYVATAKGTVYAISDAGTILWSYRTEGGAATGLAITRDRNILASAGPALYCVSDGKLRWKFSGDNDAKAFPAIHDQAGNIYFGKGSDFYALSSAGKELWRVRLYEPVTAAPAMDRSGHIYVSTAARLYCLSE